MLKVRSLVEERGGVLLEQVAGVDAEHVIRLLVRTELPPNRYQLFQYR